MPIGVSSGNENDVEVSGIFLICAGGMVGARVTDDTDVYALSNQHVYARGDNTASIGEPILQPGLLDTECQADPNDRIGQLAAFKPVGATGNTIDAAIASTTTALVSNSTPSDGYGTPKSVTVPASVGQKVQKYGRTTGLTKGEVTMISVTVIVSGNVFDDQIIVESRKPFIKGGDSGSLLVTNPGKNPVGLLFAGNENGKLAVANRIDLVLTELGNILGKTLSIDGE